MKKIDIQQFALRLEDNLFQLHEELKSKTYHHSPYTSFYISDPKLRHIHKACVRDRVLHHAIFRILSPIFEKSFIYDSYSCRLEKGAHRAINRLKVFLDRASCNNSKNVYIVKCDIKKFFDSIDHSILFGVIQKKISDQNVLWLTKTLIDSFNSETGVGLPIGNVTSQLFANIYLNGLDQFVKHILKIRFYVRYCDDFIIVRYSDDVIREIEYFLHNYLKLKIHQDKILVRKYRQGIDFLGYVVLPYHKTLRTKTKKRMFRKADSKSYQSYKGLLKHCNGHILERLLETRATDIFNPHV